MRHKKWDEVLQYVGLVAESLGKSIYDVRCRMRWDAGQAVCAEAYGENWMNDPDFDRWCDKSDLEPPDPHYYECAKKMANGYIPEWVGCQTCNQPHGKTYGDGEWCENCVPY